MSGFSLNDSFHKAPDLRLREVPEWGSLLVYTPARPDIYYLDARSWLVFELCDGRTGTQILDEFRESVPADVPAERSEQAVVEALTALAHKGIVSRTAAGDATGRTAEGAGGAARPAPAARVTTPG
jgi:Coenzyme PQQ synthesis protein D (PqqD)